MKIGPRNYYDHSPTKAVAAGDLWRDLPSQGLLCQQHVRGLVITPACDLSNHKAATITYLPIVSVPEYFALSASLPEIRRHIFGQLTHLNVEVVEQFPQHGFFLPAQHVIEDVEEQMRHLLADTQSVKSKTAAERVIAGMRLIRTISCPTSNRANVADIVTLFGPKEWAKTAGNVVRNAYKQCVYFLPSDEQPVEWSAVPEHSLVLFRYPITAPIEVLECAQDISLADWPIAVEDIAQTVPSAESFSIKQPLKWALQQNLWGRSGSGSAPIVWYRAISAAS